MSNIQDLKYFAAHLCEAIVGCGARAEFANQDFIHSRFNSLALDLFKLQFKCNRIYRRFCEARQCSPDFVREWSQVPAMPAEAFKEMVLTSIPESERITVFHSSGTTGQKPSKNWHSKTSLALYETSLLSGFERRFCPAGSRRPEWLLALTPHAKDAPNSSLVHMFQCVAAKLRVEPRLFGCHTAEDGGWNLAWPDTELFLRRAVDSGRPGLVLTTAFGMVHLIDKLRESGRRFRLPAGTRILETGGYKGRSRQLAKHELYDEIAHWLDIPHLDIIAEYGMSELSSQAYDRETGNSTGDGNRVFRFPEWARAQVVSPESGAEVAEGETGLIRILDLANVFSVSAVQTGDLGIRRGDGFELVGRAEYLEPRGCSLMAIS